jgi:hypothetical protein
MTPEEFTAWANTLNPGHHLSVTEVAEKAGCDRIGAMGLVEEARFLGYTQHPDFSQDRAGAVRELLRLAREVLTDPDSGPAARKLAEASITWITENARDITALVLADMPA